MAVLKSPVTQFILIFLLASALRLAGITSDSLWLDESYQSMADAFGQKVPDFLNPTDKPFIFRFDKPQPIARVLSNFRQVDPLCPPLYGIMLNRWMLFFGTGDLAVRCLSACLSLGSLVALFFLARSLLGLRPALLAMLMQAISPFDIYYAQEARMYSLTVLCSALSCGSLALLLLTGKSRQFKMAAAIIYIVSTWALINTHYTGLFTVMFQLLYGLWWCARQRDLGLLGGLTVAWAAVCLLWLPWFEIFRQAASVRTGSFYVARQPTWFWPFWALLARIPYNWIVFLAGKQVVAYAVPLYLTSTTFLIAAVLAVMPEKARRKLADGRIKIFTMQSDSFENKSNTNKGRLAFLVTWALVPALIIWLSDMVEAHRVVEIARYLIATSPAIYILVGYALSLCWAKGKVIVLLVHVLFAMVNNLYAHLVPQREPWAQMARKVETLCRPEDLLLVSQYYNIVCLNRYLTQPRRQIGITPGQGAAHIASLLSKCHRFWLLTAQEGESVKLLVPARFKLKTQTDLQHALHLRFYED